MLMRSHLPCLPAWQNHDTTLSSEATKATSNKPPHAHLLCLPSRRLSPHRHLPLPPLAPQQRRACAALHGDGAAGEYGEGEESCAERAGRISAR